MAYGELSTFLPRAEGEVLDTERAKSEGASRAAYLSSMDQFYEQLEESARQFDIQQALSQRQFDWLSGFEETKLDEETRLAEERLELEGELGRGKLEIDRAVADSQSKYYDSQTELGRGRLEIEKQGMELQRNEQSYLQSYYNSQFQLEEKRFGLEEELADYKMGGSNQGQYSTAPWIRPQEAWWKNNKTSSSSDFTQAKRL